MTKRMALTIPPLRASENLGGRCGSHLMATAARRTMAKKVSMGAMTVVIQIRISPPSAALRATLSIVSTMTEQAMKPPRNSNNTKATPRSVSVSSARFLPVNSSEPKMVPRHLRSSAMTLVAAYRRSKPPRIGEKPLPTQRIFWPRRDAK